MFVSVIKTPVFLSSEFCFRFNVRRHQMLYCPQKDEIDPRELGLGKLQDEPEDDALVEAVGIEVP